MTDSEDSIQHKQKSGVSTGEMEPQARKRKRITSVTLQSKKPPSEARKPWYYEDEYGHKNPDESNPALGWGIYCEDESSEDEKPKKRTKVKKSKVLQPVNFGTFTAELSKNTEEQETPVVKPKPVVAHGSDSEDDPTTPKLEQQETRIAESGYAALESPAKTQHVSSQMKVIHRPMMRKPSGYSMFKRKHLFSVEPKSAADLVSDEPINSKSTMKRRNQQNQAFTIPPAEVAQKKYNLRSRKVSGASVGTEAWSGGEEITDKRPRGHGARGGFRSGDAAKGPQPRRVLEVVLID